MKEKVNKIINVFKRYEMKYVVTKEQMDKLYPIILQHMKEDEYGIHTIKNIYLDTDNYDVIRASIEKPRYKEKIRVRSYGTPKAEDTVFLELKKKRAGVVDKERVDMTFAELESFLNDGVYPEERDCQILRELDYSIKTRGLKGKAFITYVRRALFSESDKNLRITIDREVLGRVDDVSLQSDPYGEYILPEDHMLMEIKVAGAFPEWLSTALAEIGIEKKSFSKYGKLYKNYIMPTYFPDHTLDVVEEKYEVSEKELEALQI